ncbi:MAG TPA: hypothetical protein VME19_00185 [Streptosporangiaceae bacterium]|nr:hypothetical protein [Streptosporangiaceae bacterium]
MATLTVTGRADLTDEQWAVLEPLLPRGTKPGRPPERCHDITCTHRAVATC